MTFVGDILIFLSGPDADFMNSCIYIYSKKGEDWNRWLKIPDPLFSCSALKNFVLNQNNQQKHQLTEYTIILSGYEILYCFKINLFSACLSSGNFAWLLPLYSSSFPSPF